ncbi:hypothetical protein RJ639_002037 [Escallonia herrerae]|uniref:Nuclear cap-binding protein subunit 2 n=1 Tax=Escallonia herrerae TaxID=1293975 RepID=A0AA88XBG8_9ASTE|nr:hypothetical protein RJ639_002037 [Escallonia herrerae]
MARKNLAYPNTLPSKRDRGNGSKQAAAPPSPSQSLCRTNKSQQRRRSRTSLYADGQPMLPHDPNKISAYRDRRFQGTQEEFEHALLTSTTVYVGNMSFYTTEEQVYELFSRGGEIKKIVMGLDKNTKTPCGFCFLMYYSREDAEDSVKYLSGTILDDRPIRVDFDWGFQEGRQWGRGRSGGQKELEAQRHLVDYGTGSLGSFPSVMQPQYGRHGGNRGHGASNRHGRDYNRKRHREDDRHALEMSKRTTDHESRRNSDHDSRPEKNPRFRESGDSDDDEEDGRKRRP